MSLQTAGIAQHCKALRLAAVGAQFASLAEEAGQRNHSHLHYLEALLQAEMEDRERRGIELRMKEAHLPRIKTLEEFDFAQSPHIPAARTNARLCKAVLDRLTDQAHIIETGSESYRFRRTLRKKTRE
jgi:DNA replication protein DnaC